MAKKWDKRGEGEAVWRKLRSYEVALDELYKAYKICHYLEARNILKFLDGDLFLPNAHLKQLWSSLFV